MKRTYRFGHHIFRVLDKPISVGRESVREGLFLHSESGRITQVAGVQSAKTRDGTEVMFAPNGAVIDHPEHGTIELPPGTYQVDQVREARPEEERARTLVFESPRQEPTSLTREQLD